MKIALCLHGLFDSLTDKSSKGIDGYEHIKKRILDKGDVDIFIHSWELNKEKEIIDLYKPKESLFEEQESFDNIILERKFHRLKKTPRPPQNVFSHLRSVSKAINLAIESKCDYDIVIKARFDLGRINRKSAGPFNKSHPYPVQCINFSPKINANALYMADWNHFDMGPADMWFYGDMNIMSNFRYLYEDFKNDCYIDSEFHDFAIAIENNPGDLINAIAYYKYWMIKRNLWNKKIPLCTTWE